MIWLLRMPTFREGRYCRRVQYLLHARTRRRTTDCITLQRTATQASPRFNTSANPTGCNILKNTATHCNTSKRNIYYKRELYGVPVITTHCNTLQHTATHCNTLQHTATHYGTLQHRRAHNLLQTRTRRPLQQTQQCICWGFLSDSVARHDA